MAKEDIKPEAGAVGGEENKNVKPRGTHSEAPAEAVEEAPKNEDAALEQELAAEDERLPFPNARVVYLLKKDLDKEKIVRARVKKEMNEFLGRIVQNVAREMNKSPYTVIEGGDLHRAIKKYEKMEEIASQKERLIGYMDRIKQDCNVLISDVERSFDLEGQVKAFNAPKEEPAPVEEAPAEEQAE
jgi:hypothetical protein